MSWLEWYIYSSAATLFVLVFLKPFIIKRIEVVRELISIVLDDEEIDDFFERFEKRTIDYSDVIISVIPYANLVVLSIAACFTLYVVRKSKKQKE